MRFIAVRINADTRKRGNYSKFPSVEEYKGIWEDGPDNGFHECVNFKNFKGSIKGYLPPTGKKFIPNEPFGIFFLTPKTNTPQKQSKQIIGIQVKCQYLKQDIIRTSVPRKLDTYLKGKDAQLTYNYVAPYDFSMLFKNKIANASEVLIPPFENDGKIWTRHSIRPISEQNLPKVLDLIERNLSADEKMQWQNIKECFDVSTTLFECDFEEKVRELMKSKSINLNPEGNRHPKKIITKTSSFIRSPEIVAAVLKRAKGRCEKCKKPAPFNRKKDGSPYLEVHHIRQLKDGGADTMKNAIALCPNCHRKMHFG